MFLGRLNRLAGPILLAALGLLQIRRVSLDVVDVLGDAPELALLRMGIPQNFDRRAVHSGEQRTATDESLGTGRLDRFELQFHSGREAICVRGVHAQARGGEDKPFFAEASGRMAAN